MPSFDALEYVVCLGDTRFSQVNNGPRANVFPAGEANFGQAMYRSWKGQPRTPGMDLISTASRRHLLGGALMWPGYFGAVFRGLFGLYPSSLSKSSGFVSVSGKTSSFQVSYARAHLAKR